MTSEIFNAAPWIVRAEWTWRMLSTTFPPWAAVHQQTRGGIAAECFGAIVHDLRALLRTAEDRDPAPSAVVLDGRTLRSTPESGHRAGDDGHERTKQRPRHRDTREVGGSGGGGSQPDQP